jgi:hypothetical protein
MRCMIISQRRVDLSPSIEEYLFESARKLALTCDSLTSCKLHFERRAGRNASNACDVSLTLFTTEHSLQVCSSSTCATEDQMVIEAANLAFSQAKQALKDLRHRGECTACSH